MKIQIIRPIQSAKDLHNNIGWSTPNDFTLEEIADYLGILVKESPMQGSEGRILMKGNSAIISINSGINHQGKKNFVLAHEIGHFLMHKDLDTLFLDTHKTLADWHKNGQHEQQANEFASELLMPSSLFTSRVKGKKLNLGLIEDTASFFNASLTATFLKYRALGDFPVMIIYIEEGLIKWKQHSHDFPFTYITHNSKVPTWTVAGDFFNGKGIEAKPVKIDAIEWFPEDNGIEFKKDWKLWEQCFQVSENGLISCLWAY